MDNLVFLNGCERDMIIDIIDKLLDRCIQFVEYKETEKRRVFNEFIEPIFSQFESVHEQYLKDFLKYKKTIESEDKFSKLVKPLCDNLREDNLFTAVQRIKLKQLSKIKNEKNVGNFVSDISSYLGNIWISAYGDREARVFLDPTQQRWRTGLISDLMEIDSKNDLTDDQKKAEAIEMLESTAKEMQIAYSNVFSSFTELKEDLLG